MKSFSATTTINASPEIVWSILTNASQFTDWDPNMLKLEGNIAPGEKLSILTDLAPDRAFTPTVSKFDEPELMIWSSGMPLGLFSGVRTFMLEATAAGGTNFTLTEEFSGLLLPLFGGSIPDMNPIFDGFCSALKERAESM